jgi:hypothetical protein
MTWTRLGLVVTALVTALPARAAAQSSLAGETFHISRASGPIKIDGELSDNASRSRHSRTRGDGMNVSHARLSKSSKQAATFPRQCRRFEYSSVTPNCRHTSR